MLLFLHMYCNHNKNVCINIDVSKGMLYKHNHCCDTLILSVYNPSALSPVLDFIRRHLVDIKGTRLYHFKLIPFNVVGHLYK